MEDSEESRLEVFKQQQLENFHRTNSSLLLGRDCGKEAGCCREEFGAGGLARALSGSDDTVDGRYGLRCERAFLSPFMFLTFPREEMIVYEFS